MLLEQQRQVQVDDLLELGEQALVSGRVVILPQIHDADRAERLTIRPEQGQPQIGDDAALHRLRVLPGRVRRSVGNFQDAAGTHRLVAEVPAAAP
ncbi:MAG: hypothetical protein U5R48_10585 [Gammaproteobacteria bacterium]|nr:hypothetical protein [Gammaproteobacteria bacterium]